MCFDNFAAVRLKDQQRLLSPFQLATFRSSPAYAASTAYFDHPTGQSTLLDRILYADMKTYLVELLMKQDQMSMAASIESRVPFLDHKLVEFAAGLPDEWKLSGWVGKRILREAMKGVVPDPILTRPKMGFPVPFGSWVRDGWGDVVRDVLLDRRTRERGVLNVAAVDQLMREHREGLVAGGARLWTLMNLELWYRTFIDKQGIQTLAAPRDNATVQSMPHAMADAVQTT
jgi:asparagine synthase (glutamine-hydrolysing)